MHTQTGKHCDNVCIGAAGPGLFQVCETDCRLLEQPGRVSMGGLWARCGHQMRGIWHAGLTMSGHIYAPLESAGVTELRGTAQLA
jgi:hypothetical protein